MIQPAADLPPSLLGRPGGAAPFGDAGVFAALLAASPEGATGKPVARQSDAVPGNPVPPSAAPEASALVALFPTDVPPSAAAGVPFADATPQASGTALPVGVPNLRPEATFSAVAIVTTVRPVIRVVAGGTAASDIFPSPASASSTRTFAADDVSLAPPPVGPVSVTDRPARLSTAAATEPKVADRIGRAAQPMTRAAVEAREHAVADDSEEDADSADLAVPAVLEPFLPPCATPALLPQAAMQDAPSPLHGASPSLEIAPPTDTLHTDAPEIRQTGASFARPPAASSAARQGVGTSAPPPPGDDAVRAPNPAAPSAIGPSQEGVHVARPVSRSVPASPMPPMAAVTLPAPRDPTAAAVRTSDAALAGIPATPLFRSERSRTAAPPAPATAVPPAFSILRPAQTSAAAPALPLPAAIPGHWSITPAARLPTGVEAPATTTYPVAATIAPVAPVVALPTGTIAAATTPAAPAAAADGPQPTARTQPPVDASPQSLAAPATLEAARMGADMGALASGAGDLSATQAMVSAAIVAPSSPAPSVATSTLDVRQERWPHDMAAQIERLRDAVDAVDTRIRLLPDRLGEVEVDVRREGETLHVRFTAEQPQTRALLQDAQPRLAEAAEQRGLRLGQSSVDGGAAGQHQQHRAPAHAPVQPPRPAHSRAAGSDTPTDDARVA